MFKKKGGGKTKDVSIKQSEWIGPSIVLISKVKLVWMLLGRSLS